MSRFTEDQVKALAGPLSSEHVKTRDQAGRKVSYIEGWHVIAEANRIFGFDGWDRKTVKCKSVAERETKIGQSQADGWRVGYVAKVRVQVRAEHGFIVREGTGYGSGIDRDLGAAHESAIKEAETDAMKRALMTFGNPFGLALYDKNQENVETPQKSWNPAEREPETSPLVLARDRIHKAIAEANLPTAIDDIIKINTADLAQIKQAGPKTYEALITFANGRKTEMRAAA